MAVLKVLCSDKKLLPTYSTKKSAGLDLKASGVYTTNLDYNPTDVTANPFTLGAGERALVKTGIRVEFPAGTFGDIRGRSGIALRNGIMMPGGVIDEDYRGEIGVIMYNSSKKPFVINKYERIAQMVIGKYFTVSVKESKSISKTERGHNGFGHTGK